MLALPLRRSWPTLPARYWVVAGQAVVSATSFLTNIFIAKLSGLATFGEYSAWQMVLLLALALQGAFVSQPMQTVYGQTAATRRPAYRQALLAMQMGFSLAAVVVVAAGALALHYGTLALPAFLVCMVVCCGQDTARKLLLADGNVQVALASDVLSAGGQLLVLAYWALHHEAATLPAVLWAVGLTTVPALLLSGWALRLTFRIRFERHFVAAHWLQARWLLPTVLVQWLSSNALLVFAGWTGSAAMLGVLRLAQTFMGLFNVGLQAAENYALPKLSQYVHQPALFAQQRARLARTMLLLAALPILALFGLAGPIIEWLQADSAQYCNVLRWCCLLYVVILLVYPLRLTVRLLPSARPYFVGYVLSVAVSFGLARWLVGTWQASGVVLGWIVAQAVLGLYWALVVWQAESQQATEILASPTQETL
ncbi:MATE family efflux transporter [Hymenobacter mucosus]|uniref:Membrane protein involved in the export of O-antigen and teichoic acid n=1 Tax=Hymenobacter mucosus TaxID=1411120 RepID=A0A238Z822_9BACT|nr:hypothetical protein [Hymenobacter mucosus]SNR79645.1 Membrane protein involved in the export of O-antigen and teichoic acid [Hymenobacter mucosus]